MARDRDRHRADETHAAVLVGDGVVRIVTPETSLSEELNGAREQIDGSGRWLLPGWIDLQLNDIEWLAKGHKTPTTNRDRVLEVLRYQIARGVTGCVLATLAAPEEEIVDYLRGLRLVLDAAVEEPSGLETALLAGKIAAYAQGFAVMAAASDDRNWDTPLASVAKIWRAGCIIRSAFLGETKTLTLEMSPLRYDAASGELLLSRTLVAHVAFDAASWLSSQRNCSESGSTFLFESSMKKSALPNRKW